MWEPRFGMRGVVFRACDGLRGLCSTPANLSGICEDLWKEPGLINTSLPGKPQERAGVNKYLYSWQLFQCFTSTILIKLSKMQYVIWHLPSFCRYWFCFCWASSRAENRRSPLSHSRDTEVRGLENVPLAAAKPSSFPFHETLTSWQRGSFWSLLLA